MQMQSRFQHRQNCKAQNQRPNGPSACSRILQICLQEPPWIHALSPFRWFLMVSFRLSTGCSDLSWLGMRLWKMFEHCLHSRGFASLWYSFRFAHIFSHLFHIFSHLFTWFIYPFLLCRTPEVFYPLDPRLECSCWHVIVPWVLSLQRGNCQATCSLNQGTLLVESSMFWGVLECSLWKRSDKTRSQSQVTWIELFGWEEIVSMKWTNRFIMNSYVNELSWMKSTTLVCAIGKASMDVSVLPDVEHLDDWSGTGGVERSHWVAPQIKQPHAISQPSHCLTAISLYLLSLHVHQDLSIRKCSPCLTQFHLFGFNEFFMILIETFGKQTW